MRSPFSERAVSMGLTPNLVKGMFTYIDKHSEILYRLLCTMPSLPHQENNNTSDGFVVPALAIFTCAIDPSVQPQDKKYMYCGNVSDMYQFIGNENLNQGIRDSLSQAGVVVLTENTIMDSKLVRMRNEMIIQSGITTPVSGDVLPVIVVNNSYNGSKAASIAFGIAIYHNNTRLLFSFDLGEMSQIHIVNSNTEMRSAISSYMQAFSENIVDMIDLSFRSKLTPEQMLGTLDLIENIGKKKRDEISKLLQEMNVNTPDSLPSAWQMFLAIVRYSSFEKNLNVRKLLENAAESVLVIPPKMFDVLDNISNIQQQ